MKFTTAFAALLVSVSSVCARTWQEIPSTQVSFPESTNYNYIAADSDTAYDVLIDLDTAISNQTVRASVAESNLTVHSGLVGPNTTNIAINASNILVNAALITTNTAAISTVTNDIAGFEASIASNTADIALLGDYLGDALGAPAGMILTTYITSGAIGTHTVTNYDSLFPAGSLNCDLDAGTVTAVSNGYYLVTASARMNGDGSWEVYVDHMRDGDVELGAPVLTSDSPGHHTSGLARLFLVEADDYFRVRYIRGDTALSDPDVTVRNVVLQAMYMGDL